MLTFTEVTSIPRNAIRVDTRYEGKRNLAW